MKEQLAQKPSVHRFHKAYTTFGIDVAGLYAQLDIDPDIMASAEGTLSMDTYFSLLDSASRQCGVRFLSATLATSYESTDLGVLSYLVRNARNFEHALEILRRYVTLVSPGSEISLIEGDSEFVMTYRFPSTPPEKCYQDVEGTVVQFVLMIRDLVQDEEWEPEHVYFAHAAKLDSDPATFPFGKLVVFGHAFSGVSFPKTIIQHPIDNADPALLSLLEAQVLASAADLGTGDSFLGRVRLLVSSGLGKQSVTSDDIALAMGMSRRTFYRHLEEHDTSYNAVREEVVFDLAKTSLINSSAPISHIAQELGYSDSSAFNRVFRRLSGTTPLRYRKAHTMT